MVIFVGNTHDVFFEAGALAAQVNCFVVDRTPKTVVVTMNPAKYKRTWLANKAIYRTRACSSATEDRLVIIAPGVKEFGEDREIDRLIRKYGYRTTPEILGTCGGRTKSYATICQLPLTSFTARRKSVLKMLYAPWHVDSSEETDVGWLQLRRRSSVG